jgi:hypothetical protein
MNFRNTSFVPLYPGESPGDPELGGWRPLPKHFYAPQQWLTLSLEEVVRITAFRLHEFQLRQAVAIVAQRLANYS